MESDEYRKQCEIRFFLRYSAKQSGNGASYLELVGKHRGQPAADAFRKEAIALCADCHRGTHGWHGTRQAWNLRKIFDELDALAITLERLEA